MQTYGFIDVDAAIKKLQNIKKKNINAKVIICTIDFDNDSESRIVASPDDGCKLVRKSKTIIFNGDRYFPHIQLFSKKQESITNIQRIGVVHDIYL